MVVVVPLINLAFLNKFNGLWSWSSSVSLRWLFGVKRFNRSALVFGFTNVPIDCVSDGDIDDDAVDEADCGRTGGIGELNIDDIGKLRLLRLLPLFGDFPVCCDGEQWFFFRLLDLVRLLVPYSEFESSHDSSSVSCELNDPLLSVVIVLHNAAALIYLSLNEWFDDELRRYLSCGITMVDKFPPPPEFIKPRWWLLLWLLLLLLLRE